MYCCNKFNSPKIGEARVSVLHRFRTPCSHFTLFLTSHGCFSCLELLKLLLIFSRFFQKTLVNWLFFLNDCPVSKKLLIEWTGCKYLTIQDCEIVLFYSFEHSILQYISHLIPKDYFNLWIFFWCMKLANV